MKHVTVRQALERVANSPAMSTDDFVSLPTHELISRTLFSVANTNDLSRRGASSKANRARKLIFERMGGKRAAGTKPATREKVEIQFRDLTSYELEGES